MAILFIGYPTMGCGADEIAKAKQAPEVARAAEVAAAAQAAARRRR